MKGKTNWAECVVVFLIVVVVVILLTTFTRPKPRPVVNAAPQPRYVGEVFAAQDGHDYIVIQPVVRGVIEPKASIFPVHAAGCHACIAAQ